MRRPSFQFYPADWRDTPARLALVERSSPAGYNTERYRRRLQIYDSNNGCCKYCGDLLSGLWEADHVIPKSRGGSNALENMAPSCVPCNQVKLARTPSEMYRAMQVLS